MTNFTVKDSGKREEYDSGMVRDTTEGKTDYTLVLDGPMFHRYAEHLTKGATKYSPRNWMKASGTAEFVRFKASALRHFLQWFWGNTDEDHAAAVYFNINGAEYVAEKLDKQASEAVRLVETRNKALQYEEQIARLEEHERDTLRLKSAGKACTCKDGMWTRAYCKCNVGDL